MTTADRILNLRAERKEMSHQIRSTRRRTGRPVVAATAVAAASLIIPMVTVGMAKAEDKPNIAKDCQTGSPLLKSCDYVNVQYREHNAGPNQQVSTVVDNCASPLPATKSFSWSVTENIIALTEEGYVIAGDTTLDASIFKVGQNFVALNFHISGTRKDSTTGSTISGEVPALSRGWIKWQAKRLDTSGYYDAWYKDQQFGHWNWYHPYKGGTSVHVYYPETLPDGRPDGSLWLHTEPCPGPQGQQEVEPPKDTPLPYV